MWKYFLGISIRINSTYLMCFLLGEVLALFLCAKCYIRRDVWWQFSINMIFVYISWYGRSGDGAGCRIKYGTGYLWVFATHFPLIVQYYPNERYGRNNFWLERVDNEISQSAVSSAEAFSGYLGSRNQFSVNIQLIFF